MPHSFDLKTTSVRDVNEHFHNLGEDASSAFEILNPRGLHNIAVGLDGEITVDVRGHAGYYAAGMNKRANVTIHGNVGCGVAENIMSGVVHVKGFASVSAGASGRGGLLVIDGDTSSRCGISMKGVDIVVGGSVGHMSAFMAQAGALVICGDADPGLGDSLYEAVIYVRGKIRGLGADAKEEPMTDDDSTEVSRLLEAAGFSHDPSEFKRVASAKTLYHWSPDSPQIQ